MEVQVLLVQQVQPEPYQMVQQLATQLIGMEVNGY